MTTRMRAGLGGAVLLACLAAVLLLLQERDGERGSVAPLARDVAAEGTPSAPPRALEAAAPRVLERPSVPSPPVAEVEPAAAAEPEAPPAGPRAPLLVEVVRESDGAPVVGARVRAQPRVDGVPFGAGPQAPGALSGPDGRCEIDAPVGQLWILAVRPVDASGEPGFYGATGHAHQAAEPPAVVRVPVAAITAVRGTVRDPGGQPLEGVVVSNMVSDALRADTTRTDANGRFRFGWCKLDVGMALAFERDGYGREQRMLFVHTDGRWSLIDDIADLEWSRGPVELEVVLTPERVVRGRIVDRGGAPVADASVRASGMLAAGSGVFTPDRHETRSAADGSFVMRGLDADTDYLLAAGHPELGSLLQLVPAEPALPEVDLGLLRLREVVALTGRCVDARREPAAGAWLELALGGPSSVLPPGSRLLEEPWMLGDEAELAAGLVPLDGRFELHAPAFEGLRLTVRVNGSVVHREPVDLSAGGRDLGELVLPGEARSIGGLLLDAAALPLVDAPLRVSWRGERGRATLRTDAHGRFAARLMDGGAGELQFALLSAGGVALHTWRRRPDGQPLTLRVGEAP